MKDYWTILKLGDHELLAIMGCDTATWGSPERHIVTRKLGTADWIWGDLISEVEFETYQAFGIREINI